MDGNPALPLRSSALRCGWLLLAVALAASTFRPDAVAAQTAQDQPLLQLQTKIPLGSVRGRIDHMAVDARRRRLFVAELGNDSLGVVDLAQQTTIRTIAGLAEPQGVGYAASTDTLFVANARDGSVRLLRGDDYGALGRLELGSDADNVRVDAARNRVLIGYGDGGIAVIDAATRAKTASFPLPDHPESFQLGANGREIYVNVPRARAVVVLDALTGSMKAKWPVDENGNFPMAVDPANNRLLVVSRRPARLDVFAADGAPVANVATCGDSDDLFVDAKRSRVYVSCGEGFVDVFAIEAAAYKRIGHLPTLAGARTSLFVPELDLFLIAARAAAGEAAALWVFKPAP